MSLITDYPVASHFHGAPAHYVVHLRKGDVVHQGVGQTFWFRRSISALSEIPVTDQELPTLFHASTSDHQDVTIQITMTYRFSDPVLAAGRLDFGIFPHPSDDATDGLNQTVDILTRLAQSLVVTDVSIHTLDQVMSSVDRLHATLVDGFSTDQRLAGIGVEIVDLHVLAIRPESDVERALQTPLREQIQAEADKATYERRALAVERERAISENELASKIELATRTEQLVSQEGTNARRKAEEEAAAALVQAQGQAERSHLTAEAEASAIRMTGEAEAARTKAMMNGYSDVDVAILRALALRDFAEGIRGLKLDQVTITPDVLTQLVAKLAN